MISILFPFKNSQDHLKECLSSIISQTEKDWELIAVNDHSNDNSLNIIKNFVAKDDRIKVYENNGTGIISALKTAYANSSGELIHRMDSDDTMPYYKLEKLKTHLTQTGRGNVITGKVKYFGNGEISKGYLEYETWLNQLCHNQNHWQNIYRECVIASPAWMIYRSDLDTCGAFNSNIYPEDYDLIFRMYKNKLKVKPVTDCIHYWREHPRRISRTHENYNQESFLRIKIGYFMELHRNTDKELIVMGAGIKGEISHKILKEMDISHKWIGGKEEEKSFTHIKSVICDSSKQVIILFSSKRDQNLISKYFEDLKMIENRDYFFFR